MVISEQVLACMRFIDGAMVLLKYRQTYNFSVTNLEILGLGCSLTGLRASRECICLSCVSEILSNNPANVFHALYPRLCTFTLLKMPRLLGTSSGP